MSLPGAHPAIGAGRDLNCARGAGGQGGNRAEGCEEGSKAGSNCCVVFAKKRLGVCRDNL